MYRLLTTQVTVVPDGEFTYSEKATHVCLDDEGAGAFLVIKQYRGAIAIDPDEWPSIRDAVEKVLAVCLDLQIVGEE